MREKIYIDKENIKERVELIRVTFGNNTWRYLAKQIGMISQTVIHQTSPNGSISLELICSLLNYYPDVNANWLLRGTGKMLLDNNDNVSVSEELKLLKDTLKVYNKFFLNKLNDNNDVHQIEDNQANELDKSSLEMNIEQ